MNQRQLLRRVSRTFALSIEQLPAPLCDATTVAYLCFRVADTVEDDPRREPAEKAGLLRDWADVLRSGSPADAWAARADLGDGPDAESVRRAAEIVELLHAQPEPVRALVARHCGDTARGMARWQEHGPYVADEDELDDYMFEVAGRVGYLITDLFAWYSPRIAARRDRLMPLARECGLALQTVNVIRGLRQDYARGWVYVPRTFCARCGVSPETLLEPEHREQAMGVVVLLADKAERHLSRGRSYVTALPHVHHRIRLACMWPMFLAVRTLAISRGNPAVLAAEAKVTRAEVQRIVRAAILFGWSNHWVRHYYRRLASAGV